MFGAGIAIVLPTPLFVFLATTALADVPTAARGVRGRKWVSEDGDVEINISSRNMVKYRGVPDIGAGVGTVAFEEGSVRLGWPFLFKTADVSVWPTEGDDRLVLNGVELRPSEPAGARA